MRAKVYVDGQEGTTGLRIRDWLSWRGDLEVILLPHARRKDAEARYEAMAAADVVILCLPDEAAREAAHWATKAGTRLIDASTAHRTHPEWVYGLPELGAEQEAAIRGAQRVANPGCYATGFILLLRPLIDVGLLDRTAPVVCHALSGYSGGGRALIERWEDPQRGLSQLPYEAPYALQRRHKHIPEMMRYSGLQTEPYFEPAVGPFRCGMRVQIPVHAQWLRGSPYDAWRVLAERYEGQPFVHIAPYSENGDLDEQSLSPLACNDTNRVRLHAIPHPSGHVLLVAILDNLGKGAAGSAIQNLNLMLGMPADTGLPG
ncbi:MAG: N-acetyl-gamma-glutamyl-phosphate reductase [Candidatus Binatia bacterium]|nr:MAG: N-acetyl-gamma-glutamyl-phosphate reductase [Candidatus Binatia bacterium]